MKSVKVPLKKLNDVRIELMKKELMRMDYRIKANADYGYIPIKEDVDGYEIVDIELEELNTRPHNFSELLENELTTEEIENLKTSFDTIGDIVILEIPDNLESKKSIIGKATLDFTKRKAIYMKKSAVHGTIRIRDLELIAGEDDPITIHKEHGARLKLNVKEVYFSPRLATERKRVSDRVCDGENILDMFCGIGPFPVVIARNNNVSITGVDINENVEAICGDIGEVSKSFKTKFDRIIMNLPGLAYDFLDVAMNLIEDGGTINYYEFSDGYEQGQKRLIDAALKENKNVEITNTRKVKSTSPGEWHVAIDAKITSK